MDKGKIGIKVADGSFYPILDEGLAQKKRLVLTTVKDNQESVQIDLYKGSGEAMEDASYIGSLLVENIAPDTQGNAEIELVVGVDEEGNLETVAEDKKSGAKQSLSVGLKNLGDSGLYEVPDFSFEEEVPELEDVFGEESDFTGINEDEVSEPDFETDFEEDFAADFDTDELEGEELEGEDLEGEEDEVDELSALEEEFGALEEEPGETGEEAWEAEETAEETAEEEGEETEEEPRSKARPVLVALLVILALALIGALLYLFVFMAADEEPAPQLQTQQEQPEQEQQAGDAAEEEPELVETQPETQPEAEAEAEAEAEEQAGGAAAEAAAQDEALVDTLRDQVEFTGGVWYKIRWGDTLWEISSSFYDNPWLYEQIADENQIRNPDRIYAENSIFIPKKK